jgi:hypothetical protein
MRVRSSGWLMVSLVVLSLLVLAELRFEVGKGPGTRSVAPENTPPEAPPVPSFALAERESFSTTVERPLFLPNRQPVGVEQAATTAPAAQTTRPSANRYALSAIIIVDEERIALLTDTSTGGLTRVREGERVAGWQVEKIRESSAVRPQPRARRAQDATGKGARSEGASPEATSDRRRRRVRGPREPLQVPAKEEN